MVRWLFRARAWKKPDSTRIPTKVPSPATRASMSSRKRKPPRFAWSSEQKFRWRTEKRFIRGDGSLEQRLVKRFRLLRDFCPTEEVFRAFAAGLGESFSQWSIFHELSDLRG